MALAWSGVAFTSSDFQATKTSVGSQPVLAILFKAFLGVLIFFLRFLLRKKIGEVGSACKKNIFIRPQLEGGLIGLFSALLGFV